MEKKKLAVLTGAGVSAESGISTFRDSNGLWENYNVEDVASIEGWHRNPALMLDFYNMPLYDIVETLSHWYNADIRCSDPCLAKNINLSLTVRQEPFREIMLAIAELVPYKLETHSENNDTNGTTYITLSKN